MMEFIIYKIVCNDLNISNCYVGSSNNFKQRKYRHKHNCNNENSEKHNLNVYKFIRNNGNWNNWNIVEIEKFNCNNKYDAYKRERYYIDLLKATLNTRIPSRTKKQYYREKILFKKKTIIQLEIEKLKLELEQLELDFLEALK